MSGVLGGGKTKAPAYTNLQLNTSAYGLPVPLVYGRTRIAPNVIWYQNIQVTQGQNTGKGGSGSAGNTYTYSVDLMLGLCEGPVSNVGTIWQNGNNNVTNLATLVMSFSAGNYGQATWPYLQSQYPNQALAYSGFSYLYQEAYSLGNTTALPNWGVEVMAHLAGTAPNGIDADPSQVAPDFLTNPTYGAGWSAGVGQLVTVSETHTVPSSGALTVTPTASFVYNLCVVDASGNLLTCVAAGTTPGAGQYSLNGSTYTFGTAGQSVTIRFASNAGLTSYQAYTLSQGLWVSPAYTSQQSAATMLSDLAAFTNAGVVYSAGYLSLVPYGTVNITGNGYTYTAPSAPLFSITDDDLQANQGSSGNNMTDDPVVISRVRAVDQYNDIQVEVLDRANQYAATVIEVSDQARITQYGFRPMGVQTAHLFADPNAGHVSAQLQLQRQFVRNTLSFTLDARFCVLDGMDVIALNDAALALNQQWVRLDEGTENDDGTWSFNAEEYPTGTGAAAAYTVNNGQANPINQSDLAPLINAPIIFCPPIALTASNGLEVWAAVSGQQSSGSTSSYGGCYIWLSYDGVSYVNTGAFTAISRMGVTTSSLALAADPDTTHSVGVDLTESAGTLPSVTAAQTNALATLCYLDGEYIAYETATLVAGNQYTLGGLLRRGQYGSAPAAHAAGTQFCRLDSNIAKIPINQGKVGQTVYVIFQPFNVYGGGIQPLQSLPSYNFVIGGAPNNFVVTSPYLAGGLKSVNISWTNPLDAETALSAVEVWRNTTNNLATANHVGDKAYPSTTYTDNGLTTGTTYYYWLRCKDIAGNYGPWTTALQITIAGVTTVDVVPGAITYTTFAPGLSPIYSVAALPAAAGYSGPPIVFLQTDGQLYRYSNGAWTAAVPAQNLTGLILGSQISNNAVTSAQTAISSLIAGVAGMEAAGVGAIGALASAAPMVNVGQIATGAVTAAALASGAVTQAAFAGGLAPIGMVTTLPSASGWTGPAVVLNQADGQLYRLTGGAWSAAVPAVNISGRITSTQIANGSITTPLLATNAVTAANIAANTITSAQIAANTITAGQIAAGTITSVQIASSTITSGNIAAGAIQTTNLAAGAVTAAAIAAGAVTASAISVSSLSAISANLGTITAGTLTSAVVYAGSISAAQVAAGTFTGFTFQTAASGQRLVMSSSTNQFAVYDSNGFTTIAMGQPSTGAPFYSIVSGTNPQGYTCCGGFGTTNPSVIALEVIGVSGTTALRVDGNIALTGSLSFNATGNIVTDGGYAVLGFTSGGGIFLGSSAALISANNSIVPTGGVTATIGVSAAPFQGAYFVNAPTITSDRNAKRWIRDEELGLDFIMQVRPRSFEVKGSPGRRHHGLIAQELAEALAGRKFGGLVEPEGEGAHFAIAYTELLGPTIKSIQELRHEVIELRQEVADLRKRAA